MPVPKKRLLAREGAVDVLVDDDEGARRQVGAQAAHGAEREHVGGAQALQRRDIGAVVHLRRRDAVAAAVARQEGQPRSAEAAEEDLVGRRAPGRVDSDPARLGQARQVVQAAAADDGQQGFAHALVLLVVRGVQRLKPPHGRILQVHADSRQAHGRGWRPGLQRRVRPHLAPAPRAGQAVAQADHVARGMAPGHAGGLQARHVVDEPLLPPRRGPAPAAARRRSARPRPPSPRARGRRGGRPSRRRHGAAVPRSARRW